MCQSKQMILIGLIFGICVVAAISLTAAYFVLWHYKGQPRAQPNYKIVTYNTKTTYPPNYNGTRRTTRKNNGAILKLMAGPHVTTMLSAQDVHSELSLVIGGEGRNQVEIFSEKNLNCKTLLLAPVPTGQVRNPVLAFLSGNIVSCDSDSCWKYNIDDNKWKLYSNTPSHSTNGFSVGQTHNENLYLIIGEDFMFFDSSISEWKSLPKPIQNVGEGSCALIRKDSLYVFGGSLNSKGIIKFDFLNQRWETLYTKAPLDVVFSGCVLLASDAALVVGSENFLFRKTSSIFDFETLEWRLTDITKFDRFGTSLVSINERIFAIGGGGGSRPSEIIEEFHTDNKSWTETGFKIAFSRSHHSTLTVPANLFSHLCF